MLKIYFSTYARSWQDGMNNGAGLIHCMMDRSSPRVKPKEVKTPRNSQSMLGWREKRIKRVVKLSKDEKCKNGLEVGVSSVYNESVRKGRWGIMEDGRWKMEEGG